MNYTKFPNILYNLVTDKNAFTIFVYIYIYICTYIKKSHSLSITSHVTHLGNSSNILKSAVLNNVIILDFGGVSAYLLY